MKKGLKAMILIYLSLLFFGSFIAVGALQVGVIEKTFPFIAKIEIFLYYFFAGAIGGSLRHLYMFCSHYMKDELNDYKQWIMYIFYPIFATGTAVVAVTLIQSGILLVEFKEFDDAPYAQISIAFFVGFGFNRFLDKLNTASKKMFQTNNHKNNSSSSHNTDR
ncbi:hypothetical protein [Metabacillus litoralis]|jgi:hypothetical protein|uniref:hypothetical protein n=1 Tax=Metabacillus litoralis TaxID=152268 RepID=UPI00203E3398|nr:hypothetical protein [Metabacillus litoralis]MCM3653313.1 hypothetical protein [Metabacillus litoralis]